MFRKIQQKILLTSTLILKRAIVTHRARYSAMTAESFSTSGTTSSTAKFALYITIRADAERKEDSGLGWNELREKQKEGKKERKKVSKKER